MIFRGDGALRVYMNCHVVEPFSGGKGEGAADSALLSGIKIRESLLQHLKRGNGLIGRAIRLSPLRATAREYAHPDPEACVVRLVTGRDWLDLARFAPTRGFGPVMCDLRDFCLFIDPITG